MPAATGVADMLGAAVRPLVQAPSASSTHPTTRKLTTDLDFVGTRQAVLAVVMSFPSDGVPPGPRGGRVPHRPVRGWESVLEWCVVLRTRIFLEPTAKIRVL